MITQLTSEHLAHNLYGDSTTRDLVVSLPPGYDDSSKRYSTMYLLHGFNGRALSWLDYDPIVSYKSRVGQLKQLKGILLDVGTRDEYELHYGHRILSKRLAEEGIGHQAQEHNGTHNSLLYDRIQLTMEWFSGVLETE